MWRLIGEVAGGVAALAGGIIGTYCRIKNTKGSRERSFMIKPAVVCCNIREKLIRIGFDPAIMTSGKRQ